MAEKHKMQAGQEQDREKRARHLKAELRPQLASHQLSQKPRPCDRCRSWRNRCDKQHPCQRCVKAREKYTYDDVKILPGRMSRRRRELFAESGMEYVTFREQLQRKRLSKDPIAAPNDEQSKTDHTRPTPDTDSQRSEPSSASARSGSTPVGQKHGPATSPLDIDQVIEMVIAEASDESIFTALQCDLNASLSLAPPVSALHSDMISVEKMPKRAPASQPLAQGKSCRRSKDSLRAPHTAR